MHKYYFNGVITVIHVHDYSVLRKWYTKLLGEHAMALEQGIGEWNIGAGWLQVTESPIYVGYSVVILRVDNIIAQKEICESKGCSISEIQDFGFIPL
ncbi:hypothetical protein [Neisseria montereyensis]|uniref:Glyoxalase n=1 Tax=Neisseria montereyensis TaxID=2973938 RepID=A0ABT2FB25_9NEIS|nr:hypothetical protein [Neisseria montereyensis]MCS4533421.1 hypothetical protein [Neisseria montereyensis]